MEIFQINVNNFKSLVGFGTPLAKFSCLVGMNGVGKSTVLQFLDFLAQQVRGDMERWLDDRHWKRSELTSQLSAHKNIEFQIQFRLEGETSAPGYWSGRFNTAKLRCTEEFIKVPPAEIVVKDGRYRILESPVTDIKKVKATEISFSYEGSVLSQLREAILPLSLFKFKRYFSRVRSFDLLSPEAMRQRARGSDESIGRAGKGLASFLHYLEPESREGMTARLRKIFPRLESVDTRAFRAGWNQLEVRESFGEKSLTTEARHVNEGMLRMIAILAGLGQDRDPLLMFDEIENGVNPEVVEFLLDALVSAPQQILVTTHSPLILNYLDDDVAREGVIFLYKTNVGQTRAVPFFRIASMAEKLKYMGPGEVFADTDLSALVDEITRVPGAR